MPEVLSQLYPYFERGLPLRSADLNNLVRYLENEDRRTRVLLIGAGCFYGLELRFESTAGKYTIKLSKGAGVTSMGYLLALEDPHIFNSAGDLALTSDDFQDSVAEVKFEPSSSGQSIPINTKALIPDGAGAGFDLAELEGRHVVLLYGLNGNRSIAGCQNCEKSLLANAELRLLLLTTQQLTDIEGIIHDNNPSCQASTSEVFSAGDYPYLQRFCKMYNPSQGIGFVPAYKAVCVDSLAKIKEALNNLNTNQTALLVFENRLPVATLDEVAGILGNAATDLQQIQYIYAYLRDLIRAYEELVETPFGAMFNFLPDKNCFPRHLVLGAIQNNGGTLSIAPNSQTPLYRPPFKGGTDTHLQEALFLYQRIKVLLENFNLPDSAKAEVRVTPGAAVSAALGLQAIPFYYDAAALRPSWNYHLWQTSRTKNIAAYSRSDNNPPFGEPALYQSAFDRADFYRIEGHVGKTLSALNFRFDSKGKPTDSDFHRLKRDLCLPFHIKFCSLETLFAAKDSIPNLRTFMQQNAGMEHQGGVPKGGTFVVVIEGQNNVDNALDNAIVVGDFCLPYFACCQDDVAEMDILPEFFVESPNNFTLDRDANGMEVYTFPFNTLQAKDPQLHVFFKNTSEFADTYTWQTDGQNGTVRDQGLAYDALFDFLQQDKVYTVTLTASRAGQADVAISKKIRIVDTGVLAEFILESAPSAETIEKSEDEEIKDEKTQRYTLSFKQGVTEVPIVWSNTSQGGDKWLWKVWQDNGNSAKELTKLRKTTRDFSMQLTFQDNARYVIELNATDSASGNTDQKNVRLVLVPFVLDPDPQVNTPVIVKEAVAATVAGSDSLKQLRTRHANYRKALESVGAANPLLGKTQSFAQALAFLATGDDLKTLHASFKELATQLMRSVKLEGGLPDDVYQTVLKTLIFFYFDKLSHLQPEGLPANIEKSLRTQFAKMNSTQTFPSLVALRGEWASADITADNNAAVITQLNSLFEA